jgi:hypothetical protein
MRSQLRCTVSCHQRLQVNPLANTHAEHILPVRSYLIAVVIQSFYHMPKARHVPRRSAHNLDENKGIRCTKTTASATVK